MYLQCPHLLPLSFSPQLTMVGDLSNGVSTINFFILNGTVPSSPRYVPAAAIVAAFTAANIQELDTYPVSATLVYVPGVVLRCGDGFITVLMSLCILEAIFFYRFC